MSKVPNLEKLRNFIKYDNGVLINKYQRGKCKPDTILGTKDRGGYLVMQFDGKLYKVHHIVYYINTGVWPNMLDHIDGNRLNNSIENLRIADHTTNNRNQKIRKTNTFGTVGVSFYNNVKKWSAEIFDKGKKISLGWYNDKNEAVAARKSAEIAFGYHKNHGRV